MWCLFLRNVLYNNVVYSELIGGSLILPWRCTDYYPIEIIQSFLWKPIYGRCSDELLAYMDFWYEQYFHNPLIEYGRPSCFLINQRMHKFIHHKLSQMSSV